MSKLIMFPSIGRIEKFEALLNMTTTVRVRHLYDLIVPQSNEDYFRLRDNQQATIQLVARLQDGKDVVETVVRRYTIETPPVMVNFFDSSMYHELNQRLKKKMNARARAIKNVLDKNAHIARHQEDIETAPVQQQYGSGVMLPGQSGMSAPYVRRVEITQKDMSDYDSAERRFKSFIDKRNNSTKEEEEITLRKFLTTLRETHASDNVDAMIHDIEERVRMESQKAIQILG